MDKEEKEKRNALRRELYYTRKEQGICVDCGKNKTTNGKVRCDECAERIRIRRNRTHEHQYLKETYEWRKAHNMCVACGKERPLKNHTMCPECIYKDTMRHIGIKFTDEQKQKKNERAREKRKELIADGRCYMCGKKLVGTQYKSCPTCRDYKKKKEKERRERKGIFGYNSYGRCYICGKPVVDEKKVCAEHLKRLQESAKHASDCRERDENGRLKNGWGCSGFSYGKRYRDAVTNKMNIIL